MIGDRADDSVLHQLRGRRDIPKPVDLHHMGAVEVRLAIIPDADRHDACHGREIVAGEIHGFRPRPGASELQAPGEPAIHLNLHRMVVRTAGKFIQRDAGVTGVRRQERVGQRPSRGRILTGREESRAIRQGVEVARLEQVARQRA